VAPVTCVHVFVRMSFETITAGAMKIAFFWGMITKLESDEGSTFL